MPIINSVIVQGGPAPTGTKNITSNGVHDVSAYASADVQVPTTAPAKYIAYDVDANGGLVATAPIINLSNVTSLPMYSLAYAYNSIATISGVLDMSSLTTLGAHSLHNAFSNTNITGVKLQNLQTVNGEYAMANCFSGCSSITGNLDLSSLVAMNNQYVMNGAFRNCSGITSVDLSSLTSVGTNAFQDCFNGCSGITSVDLSSLTSSGVANNPFTTAFSGCSALTSINMSNLETVNGRSAFSGFLQGCVNLPYISLPKLKSITNAYGMSQFLYGCTSIETFKFESLTTASADSCLYLFFGGCSSLESVWFYALSTTSNGAFGYFLSACTNVTVHFPIAKQSDMSSWSNVTSGFGGTNTTVLFDLATSLTGADTNTYTRSEKDSTSTATAWTYNDTLYYTLGVSDNTNGVNEPQVGDTIYSDAACTTAVTTIDAIA